MEKVVPGSVPKTRFASVRILHSCEIANALIENDPTSKRALA
jgi:hypothetical protein